jgi:hypothetical protein
VESTSPEITKQQSLRFTIPASTHHSTHMRIYLEPHTYKTKLLTHSNFLLQTLKRSQAPVAHAYNPSY